MVSAVQLVPYQACRSAEGWHPVPITSDSDPATVYVVLVSPWAARESICQCRGYIYRGQCRHQERAAAKVCRWTETSDPQQQSDEERRMKICPRCGGETKWEVDVIEDN